MVIGASKKWIFFNILFSKALIWGKKNNNNNNRWTKLERNIILNKYNKFESTGCEKNRASDSRFG